MRRFIGVKRILLISIVITILTINSLAITAERQATLLFRGITILLDGQELVLTDVLGNEVEPFILDGTVFLPVRAISEAFGFDVNWIEESDTVAIISSMSAISYRIGENFVAQAIALGAEAIVFYSFPIKIRKFFLYSI